jgi:hypothetical protein
MRLDVDDVLKSGNATLAFLKEQGASTYLYFDMFESTFIDLTRQLDEEISIDKISYESIELYKQCKSEGADNKKARRFAKEKIQQFNDYMHEHINEFKAFIEGSDVNSWLTISDDQSKGNNLKQYFFNTVSLDDCENSPLVEPDKVMYRVTELPKPLPWAKPFLNLRVTGWKLLTYISFPIFLVLYFTLLVFWNVSSYSTVSLTFLVLSLMFIACFYQWISPIYEAMDKRVGIAPFWMLNINVFSAQLRAKKLDKVKKNGKQFRVLELVIYKADCPICGNDVSVVKGKGKFKGRLIGECDESPREHVFSFDHVTKKGKRLT